MAKKIRKVVKINKTSEVPASQAQLDSVRSELKSDITSLGLMMDSKLEKVIAAIHNVTAIVEEQNNRNKIMMDGYKGVIDIQEHLMERISKLEKSAFGVDKLS